MKKFLVAVLLSGAIAAPAFAGESSKLSVGVGYAFGGSGMLKFYGDYDLSDMLNHQPVKVRAGYGHATNTNEFEASTYYDFGKLLKLDHRIHPIAGVGVGYTMVSVSGFSSSSFGASYLLGCQYDVTPKFAVEADIGGAFSNLGGSGIQVGANLKF